MYIIRCTVCGQVFDADDKDDECPYCHWLNTFDCESENEHNSANGMTQKTARERYKHGLDIWGNPLPKVRPKNEEGTPANEGNS